MKKPSAHTTAVLQALFVTFLWSTSWVLIKFGLQDIPALTFAGLRYFLAFLVLLPFFFRSGQARAARHITRRDLGLLILLGLLFYTITQGSQFVALDLIPATNFSVLLNGTALIVAILGILLLHEYLTRRQWGGMVVFLAGVALFFFPYRFPPGAALGYLVAVVHILATSFSSILGREINRQRTLPPLTITAVSMGIGSIVLLGTGLALEPAPRLNLQSWLIVIWLAVVNTAFAFTLWNHTLRTLTATESSVINNTMLIQIALLAWIFLGEALTPLQIGALALVALGALLVQLRPSPIVQDETL